MFSSDEEIDYGVYAKVYKRNAELAVKTMPAIQKGYSRKECIREVTFMRFTDHPNIVPIASFDLYELSNNSVTCELRMPLAIRDLDRQIRKVKMTFEEKVNILYQIACGIEYLHYYGIIHSDIKPANILMFDKTPKICDFGLSYFFIPSKKPMKGAGTIPYMALENWFSVNELFDGKLDVWSFGMTMLEMFMPKILDFRGNENRPFDANRLKGNVPMKVDLIPLLDLLGVDKEYFKTVASDFNFDSFEDVKYVKITEQSETINKIFNLCVTQNPDKRPTMSEILDLFETIVPKTKRCGKWTFPTSVPDITFPVSELPDEHHLKDPIFLDILNSLHQKMINSGKCENTEITRKILYHICLSICSINLDETFKVEPENRTYYYDVWDSIYH